LKESYIKTKTEPYCKTKSSHNVVITCDRFVTFKFRPEQFMLTIIYSNHSHLATIVEIYSRTKENLTAKCCRCEPNIVL